MTFGRLRLRDVAGGITVNLSTCMIRDAGRSRKTWTRPGSRGSGVRIPNVAGCDGNYE